MEVRQLALCFCVFVVVKCGYPPIGDEVQPGSVLLPATRRGRYLANIVRRQAVDGTGIKFNKDADRMNAEAKKKVDVLSEELLPYIIAEQERRTTLYKRVMTAIQNGEKGVTIAEIRNKPPLIIRKGLMFRCPANRVPKEPDGSGIIMCEDEIEPTPVMYDSCLSAEDKDLYVADNKYFFCNRHKVEGPDLPRNGSTVIGCAPTERTSLNYTSMKCALEDTDDVVVHYRYYPDRTYKFVTELDPDREVCDHWNPCQIGYIYSLPSPDQALQANELWHDYEDSKTEFAHPSKPYESSDRRVRIPPGYKFDSVWRQKDPYTNKVDSNPFRSPRTHFSNNDAASRRTHDASHGKFITISINFGKFYESYYGSYWVVFLPEEGSGKEKSVLFMNIEKATVNLESKKVSMMPQAAMDPVLIEFRCQRCRLQGIVVRGDDGQMYNLDNTRFKTIQTLDDNFVWGGETSNLICPNAKKAVQIILNNARAKDFGTYMVTFLNDEGREEIIQALQLHGPTRQSNTLKNVLHAPVLRASAAIGEHIDKTINYSCEGCELTDITCNGDSVTSGGRVSIVPGVKMISFNFPSFEDLFACVYMGVFKKDNTLYRKVLAVIESTYSITEMFILFESEILNCSN
ncbi:hypothetical protein ABMA27_012218 [Loxostege sticticalis]|uniref:Uncharacterized protein n=1 Tax=Loxostege sticticalis TaxID=481309 RepID=A0ABR3H0J9_LOXSC